MTASSSVQLGNGDDFVCDIDEGSPARGGTSVSSLDWNGLCFVWTWDGDPSKLDENYVTGGPVLLPTA